MVYASVQFIRYGFGEVGGYVLALFLSLYVLWGYVLGEVTPGTHTEAVGASVEEGDVVFLGPWRGRVQCEEEECYGEEVLHFV